MIKQRSKQWYEARKGRVTGSAVGAILGMNPWQSREEVLRRMVREYHGQPPEFAGNSATEWGTICEKQAVASYEIDSGNKVDEAGFYLHGDWLGASPDGFVGDKGLVEIKCPYGLRNDDSPSFKSIDEQPHYYAQIQVQLLVTGREWCDFYQWTPYGESCERVNIDPAWFDEYFIELEVFYESYLEARKDENAWRYIDGGQAVRKYRMAQAAMEVAKAELDEAKQELIDLVGDEGGQIGDVKITKVEKKGSISYARAIKDLAPDADLESYRGKPSEYWKVS